MKRQSRSGYGLFQLLVVLAILLILAGIFLPAVVQVQNAAARMKSSNNLKQLGLAMHSYHDDQNRFPAGVNDKQFSLHFHLLPYLEQDNLYKSVDVTKDSDDKDNAKARSTTVKVFESPLDPLVGQLPAGGTSYFASGGTEKSLSKNNGVFYRNSNHTFFTITDGTSTTIGFIEMLRGDGNKKAVTVERQHVRLKAAELNNLDDDSGVQDFKDDKNIAANRGKAWIDGRFLQATTNSTRKVADPKPDVDCGGEGGLAGGRFFPSGTNILLCDGSVRWISVKISFETWQALATATNDEVIGSDF